MDAFSSFERVKKIKALIAMSGGVDSSVAAKLMMDKGYECIGATMRLYDREDDETCDNGRSLRTCCSQTDAADAMAVAGKLGMSFHTLNYKEKFKADVIDRFIRCYEQGVTPNPCIDCNRYMKFDLLLKKAMELGCDKVVTGHYARIERKADGSYVLKKASDLSKDQSYVLYMLNQEQLAHIEFPLGDYKKSETRAVADKASFINSDKPDSQDICFVPDGDYGAVIERCSGHTYPEGDFVDEDGKVLGRHRGIIYYTIGQRKGLGISADRPLYVTGLDTDNNRVILGDNEGLFSKEAYFTDVNWISGIEPPDGIRLSARIRYRQTEQSGIIKKEGEGKFVFIFDEPQRAITPGQSIVIYDGDIVVGGGIIIK